MPFTRLPNTWEKRSRANKTERITAVKDGGYRYKILEKRENINTFPFCILHPLDISHTASFGLF